MNTWSETLGATAGMALLAVLYGAALSIAMEDPPVEAGCPLPVGPAVALVEDVVTLPVASVEACNALDGRMAGRVGFGNCRWVPNIEYPYTSEFECLCPVVREE